MSLGLRYVGYKNKMTMAIVPSFVSFYLYNILETKKCEWVKEHACIKDIKPYRYKNST